MKNLNNQVLEKFIKEKFKVSSHKIPFYIKWINLYNNFTSLLYYTNIRHALWIVGARSGVLLGPIYRAHTKYGTPEKPGPFYRYAINRVSTKGKRPNFILDAFTASRKLFTYCG